MIDSFETLLAWLKADAELKTGNPYIAVEEAEYLRKVYNDGASPRVIRAAWNYYLEDKLAGNYRWSIKDFCSSENINFYMAHVRGKVGEHRQDDEEPRGFKAIRYICEGSPLAGNHENEFINLGKPQYDDPPHCYPNSCRWCGKRMWREDVWRGMWPPEKVAAYVAGLPKVEVKRTSFRRLLNGTRADRQRGDSTLESNQQEVAKANQGATDTDKGTEREVAGAGQSVRPRMAVDGIGGVEEFDPPPERLDDPEDISFF